LHQVRLHRSAVPGARRQRRRLSSCGYPSRMPRIVYICWPPTEISGGIKVAFQHVELLTEAGMQAVIATKDAQKPDWFDTTGEVIAHEAIAADDVLVFPEN